MSLSFVKACDSSSTSWIPGQLRTQLQYVYRIVKSLLMYLTAYPDQPDFLSDQIAAWANRSKNETHGTALIQVVALISDQAVQDESSTETMAKLCQKLVEQISVDVAIDGIKGPNGAPVVGGNLFRNLLVSYCQDTFERDFDPTKPDAALAREKRESESEVSQKRQGSKTSTQSGSGKTGDYDERFEEKQLGLNFVRFLGELLKVQLLTERTIHEVIKKFLDNLDESKEEAIESLCELLRNIGHILDHPKARQHLDIYFSRMEVLARSPSISPEAQGMLFVRNAITFVATTALTDDAFLTSSPSLQTVIILRQNGWKAQSAWQTQPCLELPARLFEMEGEVRAVTSYTPPQRETKPQICRLQVQP